MIECPNCHTQNENDRAGQACIKCGKPLPKEGAAGGAGREDNPYSQLRSLVEPSQPRNSDQSREEEKKRERTQERERKALQDEDDEDVPLDPNHLDAITEYGRARAIVSVIGFASSGKTFFVNRLRDRLAKDNGWKRSPRPARQIPLSPVGIELTRLTPTDIRLRKGQSHSYIVVDCAGESFSQALEGQFKTSSLDGVNARSYLAAIAFARAYVVVIRAEDLLGLSEGSGDGLPIGERKQREFIEDVVTGFDDIISAIVLSQERLRNQSPEQFLRQGLSPEDLKGVLERNQVRCPRPLCVAFSLADRLESMPDQEDDYDADPFLFALRHAPALVKAVDRTFDHYRFDFLSAFYQHQANADIEENIRPDYGRPNFGALDSFLWLHELLKPRSRFSRLRRFVAGQVPTRNLVALRRKVDPAFNEGWRGIWTE